MEKDTYYINVANGSISKSKNIEHWHFRIEANDHEIKQLRDAFNEMHTANLGTYIRAHIPFMEYHHDSANDEYDEKIRHVYQLIYQLGNDETQKVINEMGVLTKENLDHL